jgi:hypothetical protein
MSAQSSLSSEIKGSVYLFKKKRRRRREKKKKEVLKYLFSGANVPPRQGRKGGRD